MESYTKKVRAYEDKRLQSLKLKDRDEYDAILRDRQKSSAKQQRFRQDQLLLQGTLGRPQTSQQKDTKPDQKKKKKKMSTAELRSIHEKLQLRKKRKENEVRDYVSKQI